MHCRNGFSTFQDAIKKRLYWQWANFCSTLLVNPILRDPSIPRIKLLQVYIYHIWNAKYSKRRMDQLGNESVSQAWGEIAMSQLLDGLPDPIKSVNSQAHTGLDKRLTRKLNTYGLEDPPSNKKRQSP